MINKKLILSNSGNAKSFATSDGEFLQQAAFDRVCQLIEETRVSSTGDALSSDGFYEQRGHYNILVNGKRGSGKTTFALTAAKLLEQGKTAVGGIKQGELINLGILDPTLIDSKEHALLAVISKIKERVEAAYRHHQQERYCESDSLFLKSVHPLDAWRASLRDLAKGLQQLNGIGKDSMQDSIWEDAVTIMEEGLSSIQAGLQLNQRLHVFVEQSLTALGAKKFILVLDDIDTFFEKGWPVLEALRKYLTTPRLITLVCGDLQLYQAQVQRQQWLQLDELATRFETQPKHRQNHESMVRDLTEQYLLKVLPANRRVELAIVADLGAVEVQQQSASEDAGSSLTDFLYNILETSYLLGRDTSEARLFHDFLARRPLRLVIQMLRALGGKGTALPVSALQDIFSDWVYREGMSGLLQKSDSNLLLVQQLLTVLQTSDLMQDNLELLPRYADELRNSGSAVAARLLCDYFDKNPGTALEFMVRGGLSRQAVYFLGINREQRPGAEEIMRALASTTSEDLLTVTRQWSSVAVHGLSEAATSPVCLGTIQLLAEGSFVRDRSKKALKNLYRTTSPELVRAYAEAASKRFNTEDLSAKSPYSKLHNGMRFLHRYYADKGIKSASQHYAISPKELQGILQNHQQPEQAHLAGILFVVVSQGNRNYSRASAFNVISFMSQLISLAANTAEEADLAGLIGFELQRAGQIRSYPVPVDYSMPEQQTAPNVPKLGKDSDAQGAEDEELDDDSVVEQEESTPQTGEEAKQSELALALAAWLQTWRNNQFSGLAYPPHVWSRIWQRFYYTLEQQDKGYRPEQRFLGVIIHRQIVGFLNAVLVEELRHQKSMQTDAVAHISVSLDNPVLSDKIYIDNCENLKKAGLNLNVTLPLFASLSACPIWHCFLDEGLMAAHDQEKSHFCLDNNQTRLKDLLNLVAPARDTDIDTPTLWTHADINSVLLQSNGVKEAVRKLLEQVPAGKGDKRYADFIREHLARTSNAETVEALKSLEADNE